MKRPICLALIMLAGVAFAVNAFGHCEIPCGIYDDEARVALIAEDITTVEKSMNEIVSLSGADEKNYNQIVRWVTNKETHATRIQETVTQYFMFQRVKPVSADDKAAYDAYVTQLTLLHQISVEAMKAKQTTALEHVTNMRTLLDEFKSAYFGIEAEEPEHNHGHDHTHEAEK